MAMCYPYDFSIRFWAGVMKKAVFRMVNPGIVCYN